MLLAEIGCGREESLKNKVAQAAVNTNGKVLEAHRPGEEVPDSGTSSQRERARKNGVSRDTQQKLDALARRAPELHEKVKTGEMSCRAAAVKAGIVKVPSAWDVAWKAAMKLGRAERRRFRHIILSEMKNEREYDLLTTAPAMTREQAGAQKGNEPSALAFSVRRVAQLRAIRRAGELVQGRYKGGLIDANLAEKLGPEDTKRQAEAAAANQPPAPRRGRGR
jgi:hypothetical protein